MYIHIGLADVCDDALVTTVMQAVRISRPTPDPVPKWSLELVLYALGREPYEPLGEASMESLTYKTAFLVLLGSACRRSELHALDANRTQPGPNWEWVNLLPSAGFRAKFQARAGDAQVDRHWHLKALSKQEFSNTDRLNCPVRALRRYLRVTARVRTNTTKLFISTQSHTAIVANTITSWIKRIILSAYQHATPEVLRRFKIANQEPDLFRPAHELRAIGPSYAFASSHPSLHEILKSGYWKSPDTFIKHYLKEVTVEHNHVFQLAEHVLPGSSSTPNQQ